MDKDESISNSCNPPFETEKTLQLQNQNYSLEEFTAEGFKVLVESTKSANKLPMGKSRDLYESYPSFHSILKKQAEEVLSNLSLIMKHINCKRNIQNKDDDEKFEMIVDVNDSILEKVSMSLDELSGIHTNHTNLEPQLISKTIMPFSGSWNKNNKNVDKDSLTILNDIISKTKNIEKPQEKFEDKVNNDPNIPFESRINYKPNMLKPLSLILEENEDGDCQFTHPYSFELLKFKPLKEQLAFKEPQLYKPLEETPLVTVTTVEGMEAMVEKLEKYKEISIDLEHHSYRSFQGFTCLMQISTRDTDYIIDTLILRSKLQLLNKVFTNPSIIKIFHGADLDILWLQKDFALYVVNMFDTYQAVKLLNFPKLSLAYLMSYFCNINAQKHFQLADWRMRPLPDELIKYAREDTHYLLYIYDNLKNILIEKANGQTNLIESVIAESTRICLKRYIKPAFDPEGYLDIYHRSKKLFDNRQKYALQRLYEWRDATARALDESIAFVLPNHMMLNISEILPREAQGILACCNPVPMPIRQNLLHLHQIILKSRDQPLVTPILDEQSFYRHNTAINSIDNPLLCPHDLNHEGEFRDDLPVLLKTGFKIEMDKNMKFEENVKPIINVFENLVSSLSKIRRASIAEKVKLSSPYQRYKLAKKFSESIEAQSIIKNKKNKSEEVKKEVAEKKQRGEGSESNNNLKLSEESENNIVVNDKSKASNNNSQILGENNEVEKVKINGKRSLTDDSGVPKKIKKEINEEVPKINEALKLAFTVKIEDSEMQKKKKKKKKQGKFFKKKHDQFHPYDYKSVDYQKFKAPMAHKNKKPQKNLRNNFRNKKGNKKFKISA